MRVEAFDVVLLLEEQALFDIIPYPYPPTLIIDRAYHTYILHTIHTYCIRIRSARNITNPLRPTKARLLAAFDSLSFSLFLFVSRLSKVDIKRKTS